MWWTQQQFGSIIVRNWLSDFGLVNVLRLVYGTEDGLYWWIFHEHLEKSTYSAEFGVVFYKWQLNLVGWGCCWLPLCPCWFCLLVPLIAENGVLTSALINEAGAQKPKPNTLWSPALNQSINQWQSIYWLISASLAISWMVKERGDMGLVKKTWYLHHVWNSYV